MRTPLSVACCLSLFAHICTLLRSLSLSVNLLPRLRSICTLFVGGIDERVDEESLKDQFYAFGELQTIRIVPGKSCAFVTYTTREGAEKAAEALSNALVVKGLRLKLSWGKPAAAREGGGGVGGAGGVPPFMPPQLMRGGPPGMAMPMPMYPGATRGVARAQRPAVSSVVPVTSH